ncbi:LysR substrate-binding domain-containing protein [Xanthomonas axonopodis pv. vasculorum]|uniref:LysR substrate-binding domain-containing protein n=1 Tax=Xanthomonas axonopodis TaxID=53413 RepID=UPI001FD206E4|nr:LysR substrate-binding domain-containing protein [Xanthomonas axonopodis]
MLDIVVDDALANIVVGRFDAGIRVGGQLEKDMVAVRLTPDVKMVAVASPDDLARQGTPKSPAELHDQACINWRLQMDGRHYRWEFDKCGQRFEVAVDGPVVTNHADIGIAAAVNGLGIAYHFELDGMGELVALGRLVQILADWSISRPGLFL